MTIILARALDKFTMACLFAGAGPMARFNLVSYLTKSFSTSRV